jgi:hypothetical protein
MKSRPFNRDNIEEPGGQDCSAIVVSRLFDQNGSRQTGDGGTDHKQRNEHVPSPGSVSPIDYSLVITRVSVTVRRMIGCVVPL